MLTQASAVKQESSALFFTASGLCPDFNLPVPSRCSVQRSAMLGSG